LLTDIVGVGFDQNLTKNMSAHMKKRKSFKRGQLVQSIIDSKIYIFVKKDRKYSHLVELDEYGDPIQLTKIETEHLDRLQTIPATFKSIEI
jgi:transcription antitermination factor NusG